MKPLTANTLVSLLRDNVKWPTLDPGERLDVSAGSRNDMLLDDHVVIITACRWFPDNAFGAPYREVHGAVDRRAINACMMRGNKSALIELFLSTMRTLAVVLSGKPPKGWRLFSRPKPPAAKWYRLRTRPVPQSGRVVDERR